MSTTGSGSSKADILEQFDELAGDYEEFSSEIPNYREMMAVMREVFAVWADRQPPDLIVELGTGDGRLARTVVETHEPEVFVAVDGSPAMVQQTREQFADYSGPTRVEFRTVEFSDWSPGRSFDWVYSSLAVHHLNDTGKQELFRRIYRTLRCPGQFLLCDVFRRRQRLLDFYRSIKFDRLSDLGVDEDEIQDRWESHVPNEQLADWESIYTRLENIGYKDVDCVWRNMYRSIFVGTKS
jgi:tRNA (cmo5U34)-methyltransferase